MGTFMAENIEALMVAGMLIIAVMTNFVLYAMRYKKVPPNKAMVVYGRAWRTKEGRQTFKIITGGGKFIIPILEEIAFLSLEARSLRLSLKSVRIQAENTVSTINIDINAVLRIAEDPFLLNRAAVNLLGKTDVDISGIAYNMLEGHVRSTFANKSLDEIRENFEGLDDDIADGASDLLKKVGMELVSFKIINLNKGNVRFSPSKQPAGETG